MNIFLGSLPKAIQVIFENVFGDRHLSRKCLMRSLLFSILSICVVAVSSRNLISVYAPFMNKFHSGLMQKNETKHLADAIGMLGTTRLSLLLLSILWAVWCLVPDYLSVLKTRIVILVIGVAEPTMLSLIATMLVDLLAGALVFVSSFVLFQVILYSLLGKLGGGSPFNLPTLVISFWILFAIESSFVILTGSIFFPIVAIFCASMLPSIWLCSYIFAALIARPLVASKGALRWIVGLLDFANQPFNSLGNVAIALTVAVAIALTVVGYAVNFVVAV